MSETGSPSQRFKLAAANLLGAFLLTIVTYYAVRWGCQYIAVAQETYDEMTSPRGKGTVGGGWMLVLIVFAVGGLSALLAACGLLNAIAIVRRRA